MAAEDLDLSLTESLQVFWRKHGTKVLLVVAAALLVFAAIRYKRNQEAQKAFEVQSALVRAWQGVEQVQNQMYSPLPSTAEFASMRAQQENDVNQNVQAVLDNADASADAPRIASAWLARGELFWALAHIQSEPTTAPASQLATSQPTKDYLSLAATAYNKIVSDYSAQIEPLTLARFGLGAVAEEHHDIAAARQQYQAIIDNAATSAPDRAMATKRLANLNSLEKPLLLLPATQPTTAPATAPALPSFGGSLPNLNLGPIAPATAPSTTGPQYQEPGGLTLPKDD